MPTKTRLVRDDGYEALAAAYQVLLAAALDAALRDAGVADRRTRRRVCEGFLQRAGVLHDQCWFEAGGRRVYPLLCFSEAFANNDPDAARLGTVHGPWPAFSFAEYAVGAVAAALAAPDGGVPSGLVGGEVVPATTGATTNSDATDAPAGSGGSDGYREWALAGGAALTGWVGGAVGADRPFYLWASGPPGPVEYRVRRGRREVVREWARLRRRADVGEPAFRAAVTLGAGRYALDLRVGERVFAGLRVNVR